MPDTMFSPSSLLLTPALSQQKPTVRRITLQIKVEVPGRALEIIGCETQIDLAATIYTAVNSACWREVFLQIFLFFFFKSKHLDICKDCLAL